MRSRGKRPMASEAKAKMDAGELVSDDIVNGIVAERIYARTIARKDSFWTAIRCTVAIKRRREAFRQMEDGSRRDQLVVIEIWCQRRKDLTSRLVGRLLCSGCAARFTGGNI